MARRANLWTEDLLSAKEDCVLLWRPRALIDIRVQVESPSFSTLFRSAACRVPRFIKPRRKEDTPSARGHRVTMRHNFRVGYAPGIASETMAQSTSFEDPARRMWPRSTASRRYNILIAAGGAVKIEYGKNHFGQGYYSPSAAVQGPLRKPGFNT